ncbi:MAG: hypothetical protein Q7U52_03655 [Hydrogenophaga sp.]|uniref:hypothetical protein n=1 Tax=Hydrogenophaga sp. TaxID=1904254 RepID=UPI00272642BF|nr:hypothetical protein [Hydrogenophaga sp.]MDO9146752.1 hypothetical protein [Hydrogenophaga sp.]MDO9603459.1 hypothetical protein [Hydrogenophaga sp.]
MNTMKTRMAAIAASAVLAACGGGDDSTTTVSAPTASPTGLWTGTTNTNRALTGVVLGDGTHYVLYSMIGIPSIIAGVVQGTGAMSGSTFSSNNARDFNLESASVLPATLSANVVTKQSFTGSISYSSGANSFTSTYDPVSDTPAALPTVQGTYTGQVVTSAGSESATLVVASTGALSGTGTSGCKVSGTVTARTDVNAYSFTLSFGPAPCLFAGQTFSGVAGFNATAKRLYAAAPNSTRTDGILFVGTKP